MSPLLLFRVVKALLWLNSPSFTTWSLLAFLFPFFCWFIYWLYKWDLFFVWWSFHFLIVVSCFTWVCSNGKACMGDLCRSHLLGKQGNWWVFLSLLLFLYPVWISLFKLMPLGFCFQYKMTDVIIFLQVRKLVDKNWLVA